MAWVRIHDAAMTHPKIVGLSDSAFRIWVWGLSYTQTHLTDGYIPRSAMSAIAKRRAVELVPARLWDETPDGYQIHDYLDWNDSKDVVIRKRSDARDRANRSRTHRSERAPHVLSGVVLRTEIDPERGAGENQKPDPLRIVDSDIAGRAGRFVERYGELYQQHRNGARYLSRPSLDWDYACDLCRTWDDERLAKLAAIFLVSDDPWIAGGARTLGQFKARASWCDDKLRAWEAENARPA